MADQEKTGAPILLIGSNVRFLVENAVRSGHEVMSFDYYGDWDTARFAPNKSIRRDGDGVMSLDSLIALAEGTPNSGVVYGPGFENSVPSIIKLRGLGEVLGCSLDAVRKSRDPESLRRSAMSWNFLYPPIRMRRDEGLEEGQWLAKPLDGMGGEGITPAQESEGGRVKEYYQAMVKGLPSSAAVVSDGSEAVVLGIMTQIVGDKSFGASGFRYVGNVFPHPFGEEAEGQVLAIAEALTLEFDLRGLWGFDFIYNGDVVLIEVNPRPSAGLGLLHVATWNDFLGMGIDSVKGRRSNLIVDPGPKGEYFGQARVFARDDMVFNGVEVWYERGARDIPRDGELVKAGEPILTVTASAASYAGVLEKLKKEARLVMAGAVEKTAAQSI